MADKISSKGPSAGHQQLACFRQFHDEAFLYIEQAITLDEQGRLQDATQMYERGLRLLIQGLEFNFENLSESEENLSKVKSMQAKMKKTREEILTRLQALGASTRNNHEKTQSDRPDIPDRPPSYEEACINGNVNYTYNAESVMEFPQSEGSRIQIPSEARLLFSISRGVQIFFVSSEGYVSAPSYPTKLDIYKFEKDADFPQNSPNPPAFLQVGDWSFPLIPGQFPVFHSSYGAYMFPDTNSSDPSAAVGLLLDEKEVVESDREMFEDLMCQLSALKIEGKNELASSHESFPSRSVSTQLSEGIVIGATALSKGVKYGAEQTNYLIKLGAEKIRHQIAPVNEPANVDPRLQQSMKIAKDVSKTAVKVSGFIISRLGTATMALGRHLAPHIKHHGSKLLQSSLKQDQQKAESTMDGILEVAAGGLKGFSTVYMSLENAAIVLAKSLSSETVQIVNHRYGPAAGSTARDTLDAAVNIGLTAHNVSSMGIKGIAKRTVKDTGKALVENYEGGKTSQPGDGKNTQYSEKELKEDEEETNEKSKK